MLLQQKPRGEKDVFLVVDHEDAGGAGEGRSHVFVIGQVSARVYACAQLPAKPGNYLIEFAGIISGMRVAIRYSWALAKG